MFALNTSFDATRLDTPFYLVHGWDAQETVTTMLGAKPSSLPEKKDSKGRIDYGVIFTKLKTCILSELLDFDRLDEFENSGETGSDHVAAALGRGQELVLEFGRKVRDTLLVRST
ncbi:unnamed protein product [Phytophthora fragariaefolia]|uniref:Unnamed protein product n=1 Tax=Phytophthora fragariaefolia TaxID=1490495 RepID=A0A9W6YK36_9STRA|nr:unnamed protein product [Phytophthora fragariaefolia]